MPWLIDGFDMNAPLLFCNRNSYDRELERICGVVVEICLVGCGGGEQNTHLRGVKVKPGRMNGTEDVP